MKPKFFDLDVPIIQAPMAGGIATPDLVAAVSNAGGLGSLGAGYLTPEEIRKSIKAIKSLTNKPYNVNLFVPEKEVSSSDPANMVQALKELWKQMSEDAFEVSKAMQPSFEEQVQVLIEEKVPYFSFTFGIPSQTIIDGFKSIKSIVIGTATTPEEAEKLANAQVDAIVCQGYEAGGHRGSFSSFDPCYSLLPLLSLTSQKVKIPLIAAGGIMNGRLGASAILAGASAVQMGTAFITVKESRAAEAYKQVLLNGPFSPTCITKVVTGRSGRAIQNELIQKLENVLPAPYPRQNYLTQKLRALAARQGKPEYMFLLAGQGYPLCSSQSAADLIRQVANELRNALKVWE